MVQNIVLFIITLFAFLIKGITGFGNTLIMNSLFSFLKENRFTTPVDLLLSIPTNAYLAWRERKSIDLKIVLPLSFVVIIGNIPGIILLNIGNDGFLKSILGIILVMLGLEMFTRKSAINTLTPAKPLMIAFIGILSGMMMGLFGIGALLAAYLHRTSANRNDYRGNLCCIFMVDNCSRFAGYWFKGILNRESLLFSLYLLPAVIVGMFFGTKVDLQLKEDGIKKGVYILLIVSGAILVLKNLF